MFKWNETTHWIVIIWFIEIKFTNSNSSKDCEYRLDLKETNGKLIKTSRYSLILFLYIFVLHTDGNRPACLSKLHILEIDQEIRTLDCSSSETCRCVCVCVCSDIIYIYNISHNGLLSISTDVFRLLSWCVLFVCSFTVFLNGDRNSSMSYITLHMMWV